MYDTADLVRFYEAGYTMSPEQAARYSRWRALGAVGKADHVVALCTGARLAPDTVLDVGCGDGALLSELRRRGFGHELSGVEITDAAVAIASAREEIDAVARYDGARLPFSAGAFDLGVLSHVLEHVVEPVALLAETARVCRAVVCEVPLERNWSAARASKRSHAAEVGHVQRLDRDAARKLVAEAGLEIAHELEDPLPLAAQTFFADGAGARARALSRWALRRSLHALAPPLARRAFTLHYACLCLVRDAGACA